MAETTKDLKFNLGKRLENALHDFRYLRIIQSRQLHLINIDEYNM